MNLYTDTIRQWATDTRRAGCLPEADGTGEVGLESKEAGRRLAARFTLKVELEHVTDARYEVFGCGFSMAACAVAADMAIGLTLDDVQKINARSLDTTLEGLPSERNYCADLAIHALQAAVRSARSGCRTVTARLKNEPEHGSRVSMNDPLYRALMDSNQPEGVVAEDRHLFACLITVAAQESTDIAAALGLDDCDIDTILERLFPEVERHLVAEHSKQGKKTVSDSSSDVLAVLLSYLDVSAQSRHLTSFWLVRILAARTALPGHLWVAMGLTERPQLTAAIQRHLPSLAEANNQNMRWKRYLYKQVCDLNGGVMCKSPNCGVCSDYHLCFAVEP